MIAELIIQLDPSLDRKHIWHNQKGKPTYSYKWLYMEQYMQHYYSGNYYPIHDRSGVAFNKYEHFDANEK